MHGPWRTALSAFDENALSALANRLHYVVALRFLVEVGLHELKSVEKGLRTGEAHLSAARGAGGEPRKEGELG